MPRSKGNRRGSREATPSQPASSRPPSYGTGATALSDGDDDVTIGTELSAMVPRTVYRAPPDYHSPSMARFEQYLEDTEVQANFKKLLNVLLNRPELPYNPYPGFYGRMRIQQEKFHLQREDRVKIITTLNNPLQDTYIQNLYTIRNYPDLWGTSSILRVVNPTTLNKYRWLVHDVTPSLEELPSSEGYSNQVMVALIGPCIFDGSFYPSVHHVQIRLEYLIAGFDVTQGISIFVNSLMKEVDDMFQSEYHFLLGVNIPSASLTNPDTWIKHYWEPEKIQQEKDTFLQRVSDAVIGNKYIHVECIFLLDPSYPSYIRGEKQYGFNFIEIVEEMREEGLSSFCEYPMASLHEGVFFDRAHAEAYVSIFQPQMEDFDNVNEYEAGEGAAPRSPGIISLGQGVMAPAGGHQSRAASARSQNRRFSNAQELNLSNVKRHVHDRLEHVRPRRVKIDGFRFGEERSTGPFAWQITTPIKSFHQRKIASYWRTVELFDILYSVIILVLMDRDAFEEDILVEIYRLLHASSGKLYLLMEYNKGLRAVIQSVANTPDYPIIQQLLQQYMEAVIKLFLDPLVERSQDHMTIGKVIVAKVEDMIMAPDMEFASATHLQFTLRGLKNINLYLIPLIMELAEDSLGICPETSKLIKLFEETFPEEDPRPPTRYKNITAERGFQTGDREGQLEDEIIKHGYEDENIKKHETSVLNMKTLIAKDMSPQIMVKENVLIKYMLDCRFDELWNEYLTNLAGGDLLPPNPYPRLISLLRQCAMRMDLFFEKPSVVTERMFNLEVKLEDKENYVYHIPGLDAHGCITALMMLDTGVFMPLLDIFRGFQQKSYIQKKGPYRVGICLALCGPCNWYGRMQPYLNEIVLHEHYYIQGPSGCQGEAMQLCSVVVHNHMVDMITKSGWPVMGVYFGQPSPDHWTSEDILTKKKGFMTTFAYTCSMKQPIYAKAYVLMDGWRYVMLTKHFKLHFLESGTKAEIFYPDDPSSFYQSIFLSKDRAAFHYQNYGPPQGGDPMSIANVRAVTNSLEKKLYDMRRQCDWMEFYRYLLLHDLVSQDQSHVVDCWRILHGMSGQIEYVVCMMEVLQDLVLTCLQSGMLEKNKQTSRQSSRGSTTKRKNPVEQRALTKMVIAFYQKMMFITESRLTMAARSLTDYIENKLKSALEFDPDTGRPYLAIEDKTIFRLEEMKSIMKVFQDTLSGDVQSVCAPIPIRYQPQRQATPKMNIGGVAMTNRTVRTADQRMVGPGTARSQLHRDPYLAQPDLHHMERPSSVASNILDDPNFYLRRANNMMTIAE